MSADNNIMKPPTYFDILVQKVVILINTQNFHVIKNKLAAAETHFSLSLLRKP